MISIEELEKQINNNQINSIYLLYGEELFLLENILKKIKKSFGELIKGINYIQIDDSNIEQLISDIETPAFGYEKKLIIVKNTGLFKREVKKKGANFANIRDKICEYIEKNKEEIDKSTILIFVEESVDKTKILTAVQNVNGTICNFEYQKPNQIYARLKAICKAYKVQIEDAQLKYLVECAGTDMQNLINEIRKLIEYAGENGIITKESIDLLVTKKIDSIIFDLTDSLGKKEIANAIKTLRNLIYEKEPIQKILITLYNHFKKLYIIKIAQRYNEDITTALNLKPNQSFLVSKYKTQANFFQELELKQILQELVNLDKNYKIGLIDINIGLESILCRYCS